MVGLIYAEEPITSGTYKTDLGDTVTQIAIKPVLHTNQKTQTTHTHAVIMICIQKVEEPSIYLTVTL